jgi:hypothetical protein
MKRAPLPTIALALGLMTAAAAFAQSPGQAVATACPKAEEATHLDLLGTWKAEVEGLPAALIVLRRHPELAESVRGSVRRAGQDVEAAGDVDEGEFTLEESANGTNISAVWLGDVTPGSCAREIRGTWQADGERTLHKFILRKE